MKTGMENLSVTTSAFCMHKISLSPKKHSFTRYQQFCGWRKPQAWHELW